jgi:hypothetical protein
VPYGTTLLGGVLSVVGLASGLTVYNWYYQDEVPLSGTYKELLQVLTQVRKEARFRRFYRI